MDNIRIKTLSNIFYSTITNTPFLKYFIEEIQKIINQNNQQDQERNDKSTIREMLLSKYLVIH